MINCALDNTNPSGWDRRQSEQETATEQPASPLFLHTRHYLDPRISAAERRHLADNSLQRTARTASRARSSAAGSTARGGWYGSHRGKPLDVGDYDSNCENMKNLTVSLDDETYRRARMIAAQRDTSVSALVKTFLVQLTSGENRTERLKREERALRERITDFDASDRLSRDDAHRRGA